MIAWPFSAAIIRENGGKTITGRRRKRSSFGARPGSVRAWLGGRGGWRRRASRAVKLALELFGHLEMRLHHRQRLPDEGGERRILHFLLFPLKILDVLLVIGDLRLDEGTIEFRPLEPFKLGAHGVVLGLVRARHGDAFLAGDRHQLLIGFLMIAHQPLGEGLHRRARGLLLGELPYLDFRLPVTQAYQRSGHSWCFSYPRQGQETTRPKRRATPQREFLSYHVSDCGPISETEGAGRIVPRRF